MDPQQSAPVVISWISDNWWWFTVLMILVVSVLNSVTKYWRDVDSTWYKVVLVVIEFLSILTSCDDPWEHRQSLKLPLTDGRWRINYKIFSGCILLMALPALSGCGVITSLCRTPGIIKSAHDIAVVASGIACAAIKDPAKSRECHRWAAHGKRAGAALSDILSAELQSCPVEGSGK